MRVTPDTPPPVRYETVYETLWNGTKEAPWGTEIQPPRLPSPVVLQPKQFLILDEPAPVPAKPRARRRRRGFGPPRPPGPVFHNRQRIWGLLQRPMTVHEIVVATGVPQHALSTALTYLHQAGGLQVVGKEKTSVGRCPSRYQRADAYRHAPTWPLIPRTKKRATA